MARFQMSKALMRRSLGLWLGVAVGVAAWIVAGPVMTLAAFGVAFACSLGARALRRLARGRGLREAGLRFGLLSIPLAAISWTLAAAADFTAPAARAIRAVPLHPLGGASALAFAHAPIAAPWDTMIDILVGGALVSSLFVARALRRPALLRADTSQAALDRARTIVEQHGEDSLSPYILRPDKSFEFAGDAVVAYRVIGETVVISADPVGAGEQAGQALEKLVGRARRAGLRVAAYGVSERHLPAFRALGLRVIRVGEEAVVEPCAFTLEGRPVRKLRQSVHRVGRRGWRITVHEGREIDAGVEAAIDAVEAEWRAQRKRILGFAMSMGEFELGVRPDDVYVLAWSPEQRLQGAMRFLAQRGKLSLDTMRRVGETPNGLNEALVCRALEFARDRGVEEVSLSYAGLAHLVRGDAFGSRFGRALIHALLTPLRGRFQMDRLVLFNQKFSPAWRPRYLVYESRGLLPRSVFRVLQAEGYLSPPPPARRRRDGDRWRARAPLEDSVAG
jgi:lysyl-tRNA synthetase class 2